MRNNTLKSGIYLIFIIGLFFYFSGTGLGEHVVTGEPNVSVVTYYNNLTADVTIEALNFINGELSNHGVEEEDVTVRWDTTCTKGFSASKVSTLTDGNTTSQTLKCTYAIPFNDNIADIAVDISPPIDEIKFNEITFDVPKESFINIETPVSTDGGAPYFTGVIRNFKVKYNHGSFSNLGRIRVYDSLNKKVGGSGLFVLPASGNDVAFSYNFGDEGDFSICAQGMVTIPFKTDSSCLSVSVSAGFVDLDVDGFDASPVVVNHNSTASFTWQSSNNISGCTSSSIPVVAGWVSGGSQDANETLGKNVGPFTTNASVGITCNPLDGPIVIQTRPVANAGSAHSLTIDQDHTHSGASAIDGDGLASYSWALTSKPGGSSVTISTTPVTISGKSFTIPDLTYTPDKKGSYELTLTVIDSDGNIDTDTVIETVGGQPDLEISGGVTLTPASPKKEEIVDFSAIVTNSGSANAGSSSARLRIDGSTISTKGTGSLAEGAEKTVSWNNAWTATAGSHSAEICADSGNNVTESNEFNNCATTTFTVTDGDGGGGGSSAPVADAGSFHSNSMELGVAHTHSGASVVDSDNNLKDYAWTFDSVPAGSLTTLSGNVTGIFDSGLGSAIVPGPTYTPDSFGEYHLRLTVTDSTNPTPLIGTDTVAEVVSPPVVPPGPPVANAGPGHDITVGIQHTHDGASATDADGDLASYSWAWNSCPIAIPQTCPPLGGNTGGSLSGGSATVFGPTYIPGKNGDYILRLTVTDASGNTGISDVTETAGGGNNLPDLQASGAVLGSKVTGEPLEFIGNVANIGSDAPEGATCVWRFRFDEYNDGSWDVERTLNACIPSAGFNIGWSPYTWTAKPGTHNYEFDVDINNTVVESSEINNHAEGSFVVANDWPVVILSTRDSNGVYNNGEWGDSIGGPSPLTTDVRAEFFGGSGEAINYTFYCNRNDNAINITAPWTQQFNGESTTTKVVSEMCEYTHSGLSGWTDYYPKVIIGQGASAYQDKERAFVSPSTNKAPIAEAGISLNGVNYSSNISVFRGIPTDIWLSADQDIVNSDGLGSFDLDGWTHAYYGVSNGGRCMWDSDFAINSPSFPPTYETIINNPASSSACNISLEDIVFDDPPGTRDYDILRILDNQGLSNPYNYIWPVIPARVSVTIVEPTGPLPVNLAVTAPSCEVPLQPTVSWEFTSAQPGDSQNAYNIQVRENGLSGWGVTKVNTGKINSSSGSFTIPGGALEFNQTYDWRVKVWGDLSGSSSWVEGPSFTTPVHACPNTDFTWLPTDPNVDDAIIFTDITTFFGGSVGASWSWSFPGGVPSSSTSQNTVSAFGATGTKTISLTVTDSDGLSSTINKNLEIALPLPDFKEVIPFPTAIPLP